MKALVILFAFYESVLCMNYSRESAQEKYPGFGHEWIPIDEEDGEMVIGYFQNPPDGRFSLWPEPKDIITFKLFTRENREGVVVTAEDLKKIGKKKTTKFVTHGWMSSGEKDTCIRIKDNFLEKYDAHVFIMDWSEISGNIFYPIPMRATSSVSDFYSKFVDAVIAQGVDPKNIHLVGHSLGAHVSGFAARKIKKGKVARVTALDPALPGFDNLGLVEDGRLRKEDADFVDVIHTCAGYLGMDGTLGHVDFYPNGGSAPQPGCESIFEMIEACSHGRSWKYFAESLISKTPFLGYRCNSFEEFIKDEGCNDEGIPMGDPVPLTARGKFYLKTEADFPFVISNNNIE